MNFLKKLFGSHSDEDNLKNVKVYDLVQLECETREEFLRRIEQGNTLEREFLILEQRLAERLKKGPQNIL